MHRRITQLLLVTVAATSTASCRSIQRYYTYHQRSSSVRYREPCLAEHVDRALKDIVNSGSMVETQKAAILAALAITDELFQAQKSQREMTDRLKALGAELSRLLPPAKRRSRATGSFAQLPDEA